MAFSYPASVENSKCSLEMKQNFQSKKLFCSQSDALWCDFGAFQREEKYGL